jgi:hypothetical protein
LRNRFLARIYLIPRRSSSYRAGDLFFFYKSEVLPLVRYIVRNIDGKYAVHKEHSGVASFCETQEAALKLARKLASEANPGVEHTEALESGAIAIWRQERVQV